MIVSTLPNSPSSKTARWIPWAWHALVALLYASLIGTIFTPWLRPYYQPQRGGPELSLRAGDLTPLFSVWTQVTARSLFHDGEWPLWSDHIYCGEPFFAKPQIGVLSLTTLLCAVLPAQVVATWTFLMHLWIAGMTMYGWCLWMLRDAALRGPALSLTVTSTAATCLPAACGGLTFMLSGLLIEHTMIGHGPIVLVACFTPLVLWLIHRAFITDSPVRFASFAGVLVAVQLLAGGETMFLHNAMAGVIISVGWILCASQMSSSAAKPRPWWARLFRVVAVGTVAGLVGFGLSAVKTLPGLELMGISNRAGGLLLEDAAAFIHEFTEPVLFRAPVGGMREFSDLRHILPVTMLLAGFGLIAGLSKRPLRWLAASAVLLIVCGVAIAHSAWFFGFLWRAMPMFRYQRIPQRGLVLAYLGLSLLVALGAERVIASRFRSYWAVGVSCVVGLALALESWYALPPLPPVADIRREVAENRILNHIAQQSGVFRIHAVESTDRNWGIEHVTVPLGLNNLAGWDHLWLLEYLGAEGVVGRDVRPFLTASYQARHPARFWGMMNVRFITATRPLNATDFHLVGEFPVSPRCQPRKSAGPYLYENREVMPRAWIVPNAVLVLGDRTERLEAAYDLIDHPQFDPRHAVVIQSDHQAHVNSDDLATYKAVALPAHWATERATLAKEFGRGKLLLYSLKNTPSGRIFRWEQPDAVDALMDVLRDFDAMADQQDAVFEAGISHSGRARVSLPRRGGFLVLAEKIAHFPGWIAVSDSGVRALLPANGVASSIRLDGSETWLEFRYWPTGLTYGAWISVASLLIVPFVAWRGDRLVHR